MRRGGLFLLLLACCACAPEQPEKGDEAARSASGDGYPTILYAEPAALDEPLPPDVPMGPMPEPRFGTQDPARFLRILPRFRAERDMDGLPVPVPSIAHYGTLILRDGCLWLVDSSLAPEDSLAVLPPEAEARVDAEGHFVIGHGGEYPRWARVGEPLTFGLASGRVTAETAAAVRKACGEAPIQEMGAPTSHYDFQRFEAARNAPRAAEIHEVTVEVARRKMLEELRANEVRRKRCTLAPDESCKPKPLEPGAAIDSWLIVWPPPPPTPGR